MLDLSLFETILNFNGDLDILMDFKHLVEIFLAQTEPLSVCFQLFSELRSPSITILDFSHILNNTDIAFLSVLNEERQSLFLAACQFGHFTHAIAILKRLQPSVAIAFILQEDIYGDSPLLRACDDSSEQSLEFIRSILVLHPNINCINTSLYGLTPSEIANESDNYEAVTLLLEYGSTRTTQIS